MGLIFAVSAFPLYGAEEAIELATPDDEESAILPPDPVEYTPPEKTNSSSWKTAGMILFTLATLTAGIAIASSNNGKSV